MKNIYFNAFSWGVGLSLLLMFFILVQIGCDFCVASKLSWFINFSLIFFVSLHRSLRMIRILNSFLWTIIFVLTIVLVSLIADSCISYLRGVRTIYGYHLYGAIFISICSFAGFALGWLIRKYNNKSMVL